MPCRVKARGPTYTMWVVGLSFALKKGHGSSPMAVLHGVVQTQRSFFHPCVNFYSARHRSHESLTTLELKVDERVTC
jgi:hypothetical protein